MQIKDQTIQNIGDTSAATAGIASFMVTYGQPILIGLSILWFGLRAVNWYRTNYMGKESWKGM